LLAISITACDDEKPKNHHVLQEVIDVQGTCWENHVGQRDSYAGHIVRWQTVETGKILTYGFVSMAFSAQRSIDEATHPTVYHMPSMVSFTDIDVDTNQPNWVLHGVSDRGEDSEGNSQGYDSTCELDVVKRGKELPSDMPQGKKGKQRDGQRSNVVSPPPSPLVQQWAGLHGRAGARQAGCEPGSAQSPIRNHEAGQCHRAS
jgi:hypothetical protein